MSSHTRSITRDQIVERLGVLEQEHNVRILYACEAGSRAYGLSHAESDHDIRFIYVRPTRAYLHVGDSNPGRDVISVELSGKWDIQGWDIRKTLRLLRDCNPSLLEWLHSPVVYIGTDRNDKPSNSIVLKMRQLAADHFSTQACTYHYYRVSCSFA